MISSIACHLVTPDIANDVSVRCVVYDSKLGNPGTLIKHDNVTRSGEGLDIGHAKVTDVTSRSRDLLFVCLDMGESCFFIITRARVWLFWFYAMLQAVSEIRIQK